MGSPVDFSKDVQRFLLKKEKEYGELKFISSRATEETSHFVDELLEDLTNIVKTFNTYNIKLFYGDDVSNPGETSQAVINSYNSFLLNTGFSSQYLLAEDIVSGYMVNIWPTISPYLFIQIIWRLKWGDLLIESLMYLPLDLCVEILEITIRCLNELEVLQDRRFVFLLISKLYYKCMWLKLGVLTNRDVTKVTHQLVAHFQSLLDLVSTKYATSQSSQEVKYVQHGIFLKNMFRCVKTCMRYKTKNYRETSDDLQSFKITYGNPNGNMDYFCEIPTETAQFVLSTLDKELVTLLQDQIKQIDCFEFMEWAEKDDEENIMISLQRAIIIEIHCFMEFIKQDEFLFDSDLLQNLQQFVGLDKSEESTLTVQELCDSIKSNKLDEIGMKELIKRYKEWNQSVLDFIIEEELLNKKDLGILLEYLHYTYAHSNSHKEKRHTYTLILRVLLAEDLPNMYELVLEYTLRHFYDNPLECLFNSENFIKFIETNIKQEQNMRTSVVFVLLNPKEVLTTLVRVAMGSTDTKYRNVVFGKLQLPFLHSFLILKIDNQNTNLLTYILKDAWLHDHSTWCYMEFKTFMNDMFETKTITPDNLLNSVYIPCLATDVFNCSNLLSVLMHMFFVLKEKKCTHELKYVLLIKQLTKKMSLMRKCTPKYSRNIVNNLLYHGRMILNFLFATVALTPTNQTEIMKVNKFVEPIDQVLPAPRLQTMLFGTVKEVIQNYERRCLAKYHQLRMDPECKPKMRDYVHSFQLDRRALLRHMMLHVTKDEYTNFAIEITIASWAYFGWTGELMAYENVLHITTEAMQLALVFKDTFPKDTFISLLRALIQYCNVLSRLKHQKVDQKTICNILSKTLSFMQSIINETQHGKYDNFFECIDNMYNESDFKVSDYFHNISELFEVHFVQSKEIENETSDKVENGNLSHSASTTSEANDMFKTYQFVCRCIDNTL